MSIIILGLLVQSGSILSMNHTTPHWYRVIQHFLQQLGSARLSDRVDTTLRESQIDGFGEVQGNC